MQKYEYDTIKNFIIEHLKESFDANNIDINNIPPDFDLLSEGIIDSMGFIEIVNEVEEHFCLEIDFENIEEEEITKIDGLSKYISSKT